IFTIDRVTGAETYRFTFQPPGAHCDQSIRPHGFIDGLEYDGTNDTTWISEDEGDLVNNVSTTGTLLSNFSMPAKTGFNCNSGIALDGNNTLWLSAIESQWIIHTDKAGNPLADSFSTSG